MGKQSMAANEMAELREELDNLRLRLNRLESENASAPEAVADCRAGSAQSRPGLSKTQLPPTKSGQVANRVTEAACDAAKGSDMVSRRGMLRRIGGMAAVVGAGAVLADLATASPAAAASGGPVLLGRSNDAGADFTTIDSTARPATAVFENLGVGSGVYGNANSDGDGVFGQNNGSGNGVAGRVGGSGDGVNGENTAGSGNGVAGKAAGAGAGVFGVNSGSGDGVAGQASSGSSVFGFNTGSGFAVFGYTTGTGRAVLGRVDNVSSGAAAVHGTTSGTGPGAFGEITNSASGAAAIQGTTNGPGAGVHGNCRNPAGVGVFGDGVYGGVGVYGHSGSNHGVQGVANEGVGVWGLALTASGIGVQAVNSVAGGVALQADAANGATALKATSDTGRGGVFGGGAAPIRLVPSSAAAHPVSGLAGDLFVTSAGHLWYCSLGGTTATWKRIA